MHCDSNRFLSIAILQTVVYNLITWESIVNTPEWIEKQIPTILSQNAFRSKIALNTYDAESITQAYCYLVSGVCFSLALKYAGTWNEQTANIIVNLILFWIRWKDEDRFFREIISNNFKFISIDQLTMWKVSRILMPRIVPRWNLLYPHWFFHWPWFEEAQSLQEKIFCVILGDGW